MAGLHWSRDQRLEPRGAALTAHRAGRGRPATAGRTTSLRKSAGLLRGRCSRRRHTLLETGRGRTAGRLRRAPDRPRWSPAAGRHRQAARASAAAAPSVLRRPRIARTEGMRTRISGRGRARRAFSGPGRAGRRASAAAPRRRSRAPPRRSGTRRAGTSAVQRSVSSSSQAARGSPSRGWPTLPGLTSHSPACHLDHRAGVRLAAVVSLAVATETAGDVRVADQADALALAVEALARLRRPTARTPRPGRAGWRGRGRRPRVSPSGDEAGEELARPVADRASRSSARPRRRSSRSSRCRSRPRTTRSWLPARQTSATSATSAVQASGLRAVADHVAEAPDLVRDRRCRCPRAPLRSAGQVAVDVGDDGYSHRNSQQDRHGAWYPNLTGQRRAPPREREALEHGVRHASLVAERPVEQEERAVAQHRDRRCSGSCARAGARSGRVCRVEERDRRVGLAGSVGIGGRRRPARSRSGLPFARFEHARRS